MSNYKIFDKSVEEENGLIIYRLSDKSGTKIYDIQLEFDYTNKFTGGFVIYEYIPRHRWSSITYRITNPEIFRKYSFDYFADERNLEKFVSKFKLERIKRTKRS